MWCLDVLLLIARVGLCAVFVLAAVGKALDQSGTRRAFEQFGFSASAAGLGRRLLPAGELVVGFGLLAAPSARLAALGACALLVAFFVAVARLVIGGQSPDCHCFGQVHSEPVGSATLVRIAVCLLPAALVAVAGSGNRLGPADPQGVAVLLLSGGVIALAALVLALWQENRRLRAPVRAVSRVGAFAPSVALNALDGSGRSLADELDRDVPSLLVFLSPGCSPCRELAGELGRWRVGVSDRLNIVSLTSGAVEAQPDEFRSAELGLLLHESADVLGDCGVRATPGAVLVGSDRRIFSRPAEGALAIEALIRATLGGQTGPAAA